MNYRQIYNKHYGIKIPKWYDIHHLDLNRSNNEIRNLLLIPKGLHARYHFLINTTESCGKNKLEKTFYAEIIGNALNGNLYNLQNAQNLIETIIECNRWYDYKKYLDGEIPNIHGIELENVA